jgi:hypothetical protein
MNVGDAKRVLQFIAVDLSKVSEEIFSREQDLRLTQMLYIKKKDIISTVTMVLAEEYRHIMLLTLETLDMCTRLTKLALKLCSFTPQAFRDIFGEAIDYMYSVLQDHPDIVFIIFYIYLNRTHGKRFISLFADLTKEVLKEARSMSVIASSLSSYIDDAINHIEKGEPINYESTYAIVSFIMKSYLLSVIYGDKELFERILRTFLLEIDSDLLKRGILAPTGISIHGSRVSIYIFKI